MPPVQSVQAPTGYQHPRYAASLSEFGTPRELPRSGGWILERRIPGSPYRDAMGCYPIFACRDWSRLHLDLDDLGDELVSLTLVPDLFGEYDEALLHRCFPDVMARFKDHWVVDMRAFAESSVSHHHRKYTRKALRTLTVDAPAEPAMFLNEWLSLHQTLVERHGVTGIRRFSPQAFAAQLNTPGIVVLRARHGETAVGAQLWFVQDDVAYGHVLAFNEVGYQLGAAYALYWTAFHFLADRVRWCSIGGVPGTGDRNSDGLSRFKKGWTAQTRPAFLCGRIFNRRRYAELVEAGPADSTGYFPAYRRGELV